MAMGIKKQQIGITGSSGFIGSHLTKMLDENKISYSAFKGNLLSEADITTFFKKNKPTVIIHLAGSFFGSYEDVNKSNVLTTQKLLEIGLNYGLKKIIYTSTGGVYGEPQHKNGSKETDPLSPNTLYALSKIQAEECIRYYQNNHHLKAIILRFPNVYGPGNHQGVLFRLLQDIEKNKKITVYGNGTQIRQFLHVEDACRSIILALQYPANDIFNITNARNYSISRVISLLKKRYSFIIKFRRADNNLLQLRLDPTRSEQILKFYPLHTGLEI